MLRYGVNNGSFCDDYTDTESLLCDESEQKRQNPSYEKCNDNSVKMVITSPYYDVRKQNVAHVISPISHFLSDLMSSKEGGVRTITLKQVSPGSDTGGGGCLVISSQ